MKYWRTVIVLLLCLVLTSSISCNPLGKSATETTTQLVEVVSGNLTVTISGSGNIELAKEAKLAFGTAGRVERIHVEEQDKVSKGQVLAKLETDALEYALAQAQGAYTQAQVGYTQAQVAVKQAEINLERAKMAQYQATVFQWPEAGAAQARVDRAKDYLDYANKQLADAPIDQKPQWARVIATQEKELATAQDALNLILSGTLTDELVIKKLEVEVAQRSLELARQSLELAKQSLELAEQSPVLAQKQLDEATITAPFDGVVASVYVKEGDVIPSPTMTIIHLIDPDSMQLQIEVDELDVAKVKPGQRATIELDALPALGLEGKVSSISLLPAPKTGVVVYNVKIKFDIAEGTGLRDGMSATADIIVAERHNVLLVPDRAINRDNPDKPTVEVMFNGQPEERAVVIGISDGLQTEIVKGLKEGEVVVERRSTPKSSAGGLFGQ